MTLSCCFQTLRRAAPSAAQDARKMVPCARRAQVARKALLPDCSSATQGMRKAVQGHASFDARLVKGAARLFAYKVFIQTRDPSTSGLFAERHSAIAAQRSETRCGCCAPCPPASTRPLHRIAIRGCGVGEQARHHLAPTRRKRERYLIDCLSASRPAVNTAVNTRQFSTQKELI